jgi:hypothetical protein
MRAHTLILIFILGVSSVLAKVQTASGGVVSTPDNQISGKVTVNGKVAQGAIVTLQDAVTSKKMTATADNHGKYIFLKVFSGDYTLSVSFKNKESESENISIGHGEKLKKDLKIKND